MSTQPKVRLEDFLHGVIPPELERLRDEDQDDAAPENIPVSGHRSNSLGKIDDDDREHLKRLRVEPGWAVLLKLLDNFIHEQEDAMKRASKENAQKAVQGWTELGAFERARNKIVSMIDAEVAKING